MIKDFSKQFVKFGVVGIINTTIHLITLFILVEFFAIYYLIASFIAFLFAVTNSFILNTLWTFKKNIGHKTKSRYIKFFVISIIATFLNLIFLYVFTDLLRIWYLFSQIIAIALTLMINFIGNKVWTYKN